jgi:alpha-beta hydrolase superfamily lysophospholipase
MSDTLVATAISNWGPRFTANGVHASDFAAITAEIKTWDQWCDRWCEGADVHVRLGAEAEADGRLRSAGEHFATAATYFHFGKYLFVHDLRRARDAHRQAVDALDRALPFLDPPGRREAVEFDPSPLVGILRAPVGPGPHPTVILIPGLDSAKEEFRLVEDAFLRRGMATFALDGPGQGEVEWHQPIRPDWEVVGHAVSEHLAALPEVDSDRIGVWGVSLGGYYAARVASDPGRLRAAVSLSGPYDFGAAWADLNPLTQKAFQVRSGARSPEDAAARAATLTLEGAAEKIEIPLLIVAGGRDRLFTPDHAQRLTDAAAGPTRLLLLPEGNHGCANVIYRHRALAADWMAQQLRR